MESTENQFNLLVNQLKAGIIPLWENELKPIFSEFVALVRSDVIPRIQELVEWFSNLDEPTKRFVLGIGAIVVAIGPALIVLGSLLAILAILASPVGAVVLAAAAIAALALAYQQNFNGMKDATDNAVTAIQQRMMELQIALRGAFLGIVELIAGVFEKLGNALPAEQGGRFFLEQAQALQQYRRELLGVQQDQKNALALMTAPPDIRAAVAASAAGTAFPEMGLMRPPGLPPTPFTEVAPELTGADVQPAGIVVNGPLVQAGDITNEADEDRLAQKIATVLAASANRVDVPVPAGQPGLITAF